MNIPGDGVNRRRASNNGFDWLRTGRAGTWCSIVLALFVGCADNSGGPAGTDQASSVATRAQDSDNDIDCVSGYVKAGADTTPPGLVDAPRKFAYRVVLESGEELQVQYTAYPPGPRALPRPHLSFHGGRVLKNDFVQACGELGPAKELSLTQSTHSLITRPTVVVLLVRQSERESTADNSDPRQSEPTERADRLAQVSEQYDVSRIFSAGFCAALQTAQPSSLKLDVPIGTMLLNGNERIAATCEPPIVARLTQLPARGTFAKVVADIVLKTPGAMSLIVAHGNTLPELVERLSARSLCPGLLPYGPKGQCVMVESTFDELLVVLRSPEAGFGLVEIAPI